ncbi:mannose-1-phosphate guanylyltransferase/mannose-6-phosphate isomerase [Paraburkholderia sp. JPY158]|uniref:Mannose-1-phosphate guanylyltransferase/mannose-6-phosphate isomerase n=1 Tax=Paraburkholderia atlantica TaxID=2654982 RepID=A0A7W8V613_PARAM|nr:sugar phosphate nucleotidyltransferase [Paraburkholderia atlantica]MBB5424481.1 mannose-1-phosphate guanylyltransferase/mannose-6-phosphate isomerase [Paraburkholderia atlantica]
MNRIAEPGSPLAPQTRAAAALHELTVQPVILVGDSGTRAWPLSRERNPKQPVGLMNDQSLLEATARWLDDAFDSAAHDAARATPPAAPLVVCREELRLSAFERVRQSPKPARMLLEPMARNTAPALTVAALAARASAVAGDDPILVALPAAPLIADHAAFGAALNEALAHASRGAIVAFGVLPQHAATGYSYIRTDAPLGNRGARTIERFVERPDSELAERYLASGEYWWNSGMFAARASVWLDAIGLCRPLIAAACKDAFAGASIDDAGALCLAPAAFAACPSDSVDHAVMERIGTDARLLGVTVPLDAGKKIVGQLKTQQLGAADEHRKVARPWGLFDSLEQGERYQVKRIVVKPGECLSLQRHQHRAEHWVVVRGTALVTRGAERFALSENQSTFIPLGVAHGLENPGKTPLEIIEVHSGGYLGEDDIVRFGEQYGREQGSADARACSSNR